MYEYSYALWNGAVVAIGLSVVLSIISSRINLPVIGAVGAVPVAIGLLAHIGGFAAEAPHPVYESLVAIGLFVLGVTAGSPLTLFVLGLAEPHTVHAGVHGGIMTAPTPAPPADGSAQRTTAPGWRSSLWVGSTEPAAAPTEVLRGGATIGYLERIAILGCLIAGRVEGIAVIVAVKGLGRFSELDSPEARERFIIGTLVSLIWGCATGFLLVISVTG